MGLLDFISRRRPAPPPPPESPAAPPAPAPARRSVRALLRDLIPGVDYPLSTVPIEENQIYGFSSWSMAQAQSALDGIKVGSLQVAHQLLLQMTEDPVFAHGLDTRVMSLINTPFELVKADGMPQEYFDVLKGAWPDIFDENALASSAHLRVALGVAPAQVLWTAHDELGIWMPQKIALKDSGNLTWDSTRRRFRFSALEQGDIFIEDDADPWVLFCELASQYPYLHGKLRSLVVVWWIKQASIRYLHNFARVHGSPIRKVKAPATQRESADFAALIRQAQQLFGGGVFTAPQYEGPSYDLELIEAKSQGGSIFQTAISMADDYFTLRLLGAIDNTRGGPAGSRARAETHERQTSKYLGSDCKVTARVITRVLRKWCTLNRWPTAWAPIPVFAHEPPADQRELAETQDKNASALTKYWSVLPALEVRLQEQDPRARIDWRQVLTSHGVPMLQAQEAAQRAAEVTGLEITPSDMAACVTVNEARKAAGMGPRLLPSGQPDPDGEMTIAAFRAKVEAPPAAPPSAGDAAASSAGDPPGRDDDGPDA